MTNDRIYSIGWTLMLILMLNIHLVIAKPTSENKVTTLTFDDSPKYCFSEGLCAVQRNQLWGFIDTTGRLVIDFQYYSNGTELPTFHEGKCCISIRTEKENMSHCYIDRLGRRLFSNQEFLGVTDFSNGIAIVETINSSNNQTLMFIDSLGKALSGAVNPGYALGMRLEFRGFFDGLAAVCDAKTKYWGYINCKGKWAIPPDFKLKNVGDFHNGLAIVQESTEGKWGAINKRGELKIPFTYINRPDDFAEGLSAVKNEENLVGYMDTTGSLVLPYRYEPISNRNGLPFFEGNTIVYREGIYYSISLVSR